jgi:hypothetical protein
LALSRQGHRTFDERRREKVTGEDDRQHYRIRAVHFATSKGTKIGDAESAARKAYAEHVDRETSAEHGIVVGSIYGGIIFDFTKGKVSRIFFGAAAE